MNPNIQPGPVLGGQVSPYQFVGSDPVDRTDPAGLMFVDPISGLEFPDENFANDLLITRDFDDIYNSIVGNDFAYLGAQGAATFGGFSGGNVALLPGGA